MIKEHTFTLGNGNVRVETMIVNEDFGMLQLEDGNTIVNVDFKDVEQILKISEWLKELYHDIKEIKK